MEEEKKESAKRTLIHRKSGIATRAMLEKDPDFQKLLYHIQHMLSVIVQDSGYLHTEISKMMTLRYNLNIRKRDTGRISNILRRGQFSFYSLFTLTQVLGYEIDISLIPVKGKVIRKKEMIQPGDSASNPLTRIQKRQMGICERYSCDKPAVASRQCREHADRTNELRKITDERKRLLNNIKPLSQEV